MAGKAKGNSKHCPFGKDKAILPSEQLTTTSFKQEPEDKVDMYSTFKTKNQHE